MLAAFPTIAGPPYPGTEVLLNQYGDATIEGEITVADETHPYWFYSSGIYAFLDSGGDPDTVVAYYEQAGDPSVITEDGGSILVGTLQFEPAALAVGRSGTLTGEYTLTVSSQIAFQVNEILISPGINYGVAGGNELYDSHDVNWYKFTPGSSGTWTVGVDSEGDFDATIAVFDRYGVRLLPNPTDDPNLPQNDAGPSGIETYALSVRSFETNEEFYLRVGSAATNGDYAGYYRVIVQGPLDFEPYDPSDSQVIDVFPSASTAFGEFMESGTASPNSTRFYRLPSDVPGDVEIDLSSSDVALALYFDAGPPDLVEYPYSSSSGPYLEDQLPGDGAPVAIGVLGTGDFDLYGYLYPPSGELISIGDDLAGTGIAQSGSADQWLEFRAPVEGQYVVSSSASSRDLSVYDADGQRIVGPADSVTVELARRETAYVRVEASSTTSSVVTVEALGAAVVIDTLTAPFVILDPSASQFTMSVNWESLSGVADALQVFLERVDEVDGVTEEDSIITAFDLTSGTGPGEIAPIPADTFVYPEDVPGETVYRIRLRAFDGDGTPSIAGLEIGSLGMTATATLIRGDYNQDGAVDATDYAVWRNALDVGYDQQIDGDGDGLIGAGDYLVWREGYGSASTAAYWDFEGLADGGFPVGWDTSGDLFLGDWGAASSTLGGSGNVMRMSHNATAMAPTFIEQANTPLDYASIDSRFTKVIATSSLLVADSQRMPANPSLNLLLLFESVPPTERFLGSSIAAPGPSETAAIDQALEGLSPEELFSPILPAISSAVA